MAPRFLCLKGHLWAYQETVRTRRADEMLCPTCGLRLYPEKQASSIPIRSQQFFPHEPTPLSAAEVVRLSRNSTDSAVAIQAIQPGDIEAIPGYELLGILGRGGMGIVFRARQLSLKRQVALKMILSGRHARRNERARFQREAEAVARLQHPNIVQIYEVGEQNGLPYFSLEFVNAGSLAQFLNNNPQPPRLCAQLVLDLALAMHYAHKRGIVHRDLKPANILLHLDESRILKDGNLADTAVFRDLSSYVPKITDFGLAKHMGGEEAFRQGTVLGTPSYMAPEQARGTSGEVGPAADVYALGAILYEMLTGRPPFKGATADETAQQVLVLEPTPPSQFQTRIPKDLDTICLVCLQKNPAHRYGTAEALADDLRRFLAGEPILARRTHLPERVVKWAARRPLFASLAIAGLSMTSVLWGIWWYRAVTLQAEQERMFLVWQRSEDQLQQALLAIDQMTDAAEGHEGDRALAPSVLFRAQRFYERQLDQETQPTRRGLAHYRLGRVNARLGDPTLARTHFESAIAIWEHLAEDPSTAESFQFHLRDTRERLSALQRP